MENQSNNKNVLLAGVIIVLLVGAYFVFFKSEEPTGDDALLETSGPLLGGVPVPGSEMGGVAAGADLLPFLLQLNSLKLDGSLFKDPVFLSLEDYTVIIPEQPVGRPNPFEPLGKGTTPVSGTQPNIRFPSTR